MKTILSHEYKNFISAALIDIPSIIDTDVPIVPKLFRNYKYPVSSWPVIIDQNTSKRLSYLSTRIPQLISKIPTLYFNNDEQKIADYYLDGDLTLAQFALLCHEKKIETPCRLDLTYTDYGFKILEANIGSSIGGWQAQSFEEIIKNYHPLLVDEFESKNIQILYNEFLISKVIEHVPNVKDEVNIFISMEGIEDKDSMLEIKQFLNDLLIKSMVKTSLKGEIFIGDLNTLKLTGNELCLDNTRIHCVLNMSGSEITPSIFRAFMMDLIYFPDHLGVILERDKRNLGLLRELAEQDKFSLEDKALILETIPWTYAVEEREVLFKEEKYNLIDLLKNNKDQFVIKVAFGYQGIDVFVGKFLSNESWEEAIALAINEKKMIAQEFSDSLDIMAPDSQNNWAAHKLIWGSFGFGEIYGGVWVRMSAVQTNSGVINSATGAVEAIVYESL
ncbi:hypothetical protein [Flavobacterium sp. '19STA2R22 D10 B1']|uniref:hypothetical protein n=1 Tax=Flavobacterium aerium TaxID=3037261 RepID=UPI00278BC7A8|nr:hypothetical protein [Flavobacterium sp. '19STA2R22 D10 B1']